jgi:hypothetical protein
MGLKAYAGTSVKVSRWEAGSTLVVASKPFVPKEIVMKLHLTSAVAGLVLAAFAGSAMAQDVIIKPEQETVIREYVQKKPIASINLPGVELNVGTTLPETVEVHKLDVPDVKYDYVVVDNKTVLVEPGTRKIVHVMN